ncbi:MAG: hypothetical protein A2X82_12820 [Geobacteraceae bacterium GWC2_55_20]|nr:MAG: hypothetical protein A2X82_12820 [Geobacteraceae bacterium GWC2_55_20]OGU21659.1 MAG: hypothetical protein A2X85_15320 [Geobacteraceae bacterium GWF2_54_21]
MAAPWKTAASSACRPWSPISPHTLWVGSPARYTHDLTPDEVAWLQKSAGNYVKYALQYINYK